MSVTPAPPRLRLSPRNWSLRTQITVWNSLALAVLLGVLGLVAHFMVRSLMLASVDRDLARRTEPFTRPPRPPQPGLPPAGLGPLGMLNGPGPGGPGGELPPGLPPRAGRGEAPPEDRPPGLQAAPPAGVPRSPADRPRVIGPRGRVLQPRDVTGPIDADAFQRALHGEQVLDTVTADGQPTRVISRPIRDRGQVIAVVQAAYPLSEVLGAVQRLDTVLLLLLPLAALGAAGGGLALTARVLRPVREITRAAAGIGARDLSSRLEVVGHDEFAELATTFNAMLERLGVAFDEQGRLVRELERMVALQRRFTADASHELRTPLTVIRANTSLCLAGDPSRDDLLQSLRDVDGAATAMSRLVQDLLLLARSDDGRLGRDRTVLPVCDVLQRARAAVAGREGPPVTVSVPDAGLLVEGNEDELVRLFANLVENAVRWTPPDGTVTLSAAREDGCARVTVADTGAGIAPEHLPHLGERFYRVDASRTRADGGTGLGLSICRSIVEAHGGTMGFESAPGTGTTVTVRLPAAGG